MGWASRLNPRAQETPQQRQLRRVLALFPDRTTYEQWLTSREVPDDMRVHMEQFLPEHLKAQGSV